MHPLVLNLVVGIASSQPFTELCQVNLQLSIGRMGYGTQGGRLSQELDDELGTAGHLGRALQQLPAPHTVQGLQGSATQKHKKSFGTLFVYTLHIPTAQEGGEGGSKKTSLRLKSAL